MLNAIQRFIKGFAAKLLLVLLVLSFAVWGIGDMVQGSASGQIVASVGSTEITKEVFQKNLRREVEKVRSALGANYSPELLQSLQLPQQVLQSMISQSLLMQHLDTLGINVSDDEIARLIQNNPAFHDSKGHFDKALLRSRLAASGFTEAAFIDQLRRGQSSMLMIGTLEAHVPLHEAAVRTLYLSRNQQRSVSLYMLDSTIVRDVATPNEEQLKAFYEENSRYFMVPEYRTLSYVRFSSEQAQSGLTISQEELEAAYENRMDDFRHEEKRSVQQLLYSSEAKARDAHHMAQQGKSFAEIAKDTNAVNKNALSLGSVERKAMFDEAAEMVFSLEKGGVTAPIKSPFGWHVFRVADISPAGVQPLEEVKASLEKDLRVHKIEEAAGQLANTLEDALASGSSLEDVAKEFGLTLASLPPVDAEGKPAGNANATLPDLDKFIQVAFSLAEKEESAVTFSKGGHYYIVRVDRIAPEHASPFEKVENTVRLLWQKAEREKQLAGMVGDIAAKFMNPEQRKDVVARYGLKPQAAHGIKRSDAKVAGHALPPQMMAELFVRPAGQATQAHPVGAGTYALAIVDRVTPARLPEDEAALAPLRNDLERSMREEILDGYMDYLTAQYPVSIEPGAITPDMVE